MTRAPALALALVLGCGDAPVPGDSRAEAPPDTSGTSTREPDGSAAPTSAAPDDDPTTTADTTGGSSSTGASTCEDPAPCDACTCAAGEWRCACPVAAPEAGFLDLDPVTYEIGLGDDAVQLTSAPARLFYSYQPAARDAGDAPLLVLFNGGPGISSGMLLAGNTAPKTLGPDLLAVDNPAPWTALGHLLYLDARGTGYSYAQLDDPADASARAAAFTTRDYNSYLDAADFARALLRFWDAHPALAERPLVLVGESYGGIRASILLHMLLFPGDHAQAGPARYRDPALAEAIADHLALRFPGADPVTPAIAAAALGHLALIQPSLAGSAQQDAAGLEFEAPGSPVHALAQELGLVYTPCSAKPMPCDPWGNAIDFVEDTAQRSRYDTAAPTSWLSQILARTAAGLGRREVVSALLQVDPLAIAGLPADLRGGAFRMPDPGDYPPDEGDLAEHLGALAPWDRYYLPLSVEALAGFRGPLAAAKGIHSSDPHYGALFLRDLAYADVFVTDAARDLAIWGGALAPTLAGFADLVSSAALDPTLPEGAARPGVLRVEFAAGAFPGEPDPGTREIRMPPYDASHAVTYDRPAELRDDLAAWLADVL